MPSESIFSEEWRDCLRAHYTTVARANDRITEKTLRGVMFEAGFSEEELRQLYLQATAHVDDVSEDFTPDMEFITEAVQVVAAAPAEAPSAAEVAEPEIVEAVEEVIEAEAEIEQADEPDQDEQPKDDPGVTQLSLF